MSPEQARGQSNVGPQSDQFSLGLVLYELAAGKRAFRRNSTAETLAAIIRDDPDPLPETTPAPLRWVIERLLAKDPADRYDSTRDLYRELRHIRDRLSEATSAAMSAASIAGPPRRPSRAAVAMVGLAGILFGGAAIAVWFTSRQAPASAATDLSTYRFTPIATDPAREAAARWAPDGKSIAYIVETDYNSFQVFTRSIGSFDSVQITRGAVSASNPFWSPDGSLDLFPFGRRPVGRWQHRRNSGARLRRCGQRRGAPGWQDPDVRTRRTYAVDRPARRGTARIRVGGEFASSPGDQEALRVFAGRHEHWPVYPVSTSGSSRIPPARRDAERRPRPTSSTPVGCLTAGGWCSTARSRRTSRRSR